MRPVDASYRVVEGAIVPDWLGPSDHPWLRDLLDRVGAAVGEPAADLEARLSQPLARFAPPGRLRMARAVLGDLVGTGEVPTEPAPRAVRDALFAASTRLRRAGPWTREAALDAAAEALGTDRATVEANLFADLPSTRAVTLPEPLPDPSGLALRVNAALASSLLHRAREVRLRLFGNARDVVRHVRLQRLLFEARRTPDGLELSVSGPFALFRRTTLYGRAYASIAPRLPWCERFALTATCAVRGGDAVLTLGPADPIWPAAPPRRFDSALEERFAADLARKHPGWVATREPDAVPVDDALLFPDFALHRAEAPDRRWYLEIVGFWTPEYLNAKVARLARAGHGWIVCVDERLDCGVDALPASVHVVPFRRRIDVAAVLARLAEVPPTAAARGPEVAVPASAVWLDWAGRRRPDDPLHARLAAVRIGQPVSLRLQAGRVHVIDADGLAISAWSAAASAAWSGRLAAVRAARVHALLPRTPEQSAAGFRGALRSAAWTVPLVTVELAP